MCEHNSSSTQGLLVARTPGYWGRLPTREDLIVGKSGVDIAFARAGCLTFDYNYILIGSGFQFLGEIYETKDRQDKQPRSSRVVPRQTWND